MITILTVAGCLAGLYLGQILFGNGTLGTIMGFLLGSNTGLLFEVHSLNRRLSALEKYRRTTPLPAPTVTPVKKTSPPTTKLPTKSPKFPSAAQKYLTDRVKNLLNTGNLPVKTGILVCFFGIAFLLKYAVDHQLFYLSLAMRHWLSAGFAGILLLIGYRLRQSLPLYAISLQGGGIGILYLTVYSSMGFFALLDKTPAFALLTLLTIGCGLLAIGQNARSLAVLAIIGGFLAPLLIPAYNQDPLLLFSWYGFLNLGIAVIAWFRPWRELNTIGFLFTFIIAGFWGYHYYSPPWFMITEPFLIGHFLLYQLIVVLFAHRQPPKLKGLVDGTLVFGTPIAAFTLQAGLLTDSEYGLAGSALIVSLLYGLGAFRLHTQFKLLSEAWLALAVAFATVAVPLAFQAQWTSAVWALEGAALIWVSQRQKHPLGLAFGLFLIITASLAFFLDGSHYRETRAIVNGHYFGIAVIFLSSLLGAWCFHHDVFFKKYSRPAGYFLLIWGLLWWLAGGLVEIIHHAPIMEQPSWLVSYLTLGMALLLLMSRQWPAARRTTLGFLPLLWIPTGMTVNLQGHPGMAFGTIIWPLAFALQWVILYRQLPSEKTWPAGIHLASLFFFTALAAWETGWQIRQWPLNDLWVWTTVSTLLGIIIMIISELYRRRLWPVSAFPNIWLIGGMGGLLTLQGTVLGILTIINDGAPSPLPYRPILNPLDLTSLFFLGLLLHWRHQLGHRSRWLNAIVTVNIVGFTSMMLVRALHHHLTIPWSAEALFSSVIIQASLSLYWGLLGFVAMLWGTRKGQRSLWITGFVLMIIVVGKLFFADFGNSGTLARVITFLGTGLILVITGYFSPAPPAERKSRES